MTASTRRRKAFGTTALLLAMMLIGGWLNASSHALLLGPVGVSPRVPEADALRTEAWRLVGQAIPSEEVAVLPLPETWIPPRHSPSPAVVEEPSPVREPLLVMPRLVEPVRIRIPSIGVDAPIQAVDLAPDGSLAISDDGDTVFWYRGSAYPGWPGRALLAGHLDRVEGGWAVFAGLHRLQPGSVVLLELADGRVLHYTVTGQARAASTDLPAELLTGENSSELVLITCAGWWDPQRRVYSDNLLVFTRFDGLALLS